MRRLPNDSGYYVVPNLPPGYYTMTADAAGFKKFSSEHNKLDPNSTLSVDAALAMGSATETVDVTATAAPLQTESGAVQSTFNQFRAEAYDFINHSNLSPPNWRPRPANSARSPARRLWRETCNSR